MGIMGEGRGRKGKWRGAEKNAQLNINTQKEKKELAFVQENILVTFQLQEKPSVSWTKGKHTEKKKRTGAMIRKWVKIQTSQEQQRDVSKGDQQTQKKTGPAALQDV